VASREYNDIHLIKAKNSKLDWAGCLIVLRLEEVTSSLDWRF
jgi:hypothetical protein